ncbi:hypothetical protein ACHMWN_01015 [Pedobacter sp. UC225_61]|uniref:hypothetical protein n=1 Tax=Pedobacter sp. UC225_61 TaxID=3374623 RepID=UPI0037BBE3FC
MPNLDLLIVAIKNRKPISFEYNKEGKIRGTRIGNPHAVFIFTSKTNVTSTKIHIVQTDGVSDSKELKPFPDFRMFNIEDLTSMVVLEDSLSFEPHYEKYNPEWEGYINAIEKI